MYATDDCVAKSHSVDLSDLAKIWPNYFPEIELSVDDHRLKLIIELAHFFSTPVGENLVSQVKDDNGLFFLPIDLEQLKKMCEVEDFYVKLETEPRAALLCMGAAVHKVLLSKWLNFQLEEAIKISIRLHNYLKSMVTLKNLKSAHIGKIVSVRGTVVKVSTVKPLVMQMNFTCVKCGCVVSRLFPDGKFSPPVFCSLQGCKSRTFNPNRSSARSIDFQKIRLQELLRSENHEEGRVPRTVECELAEDLVDSCIPGNVVTVTGIVKVINNYMDIGGGIA